MSGGWISLYVSQQIPFSPSQPYLCIRQFHEYQCPLVLEQVRLIAAHHHLQCKKMFVHWKEDSERNSHWTFQWLVNLRVEDWLGWRTSGSLTWLTYEWKFDLVDVRVEVWLGWRTSGSLTWLTYVWKIDFYWTCQWLVDVRVEDWPLLNLSVIGWLSSGRLTSTELVSDWLTYEWKIDFYWTCQWLVDLRVEGWLLLNLSVIGWLTCGRLTSFGLNKTQFEGLGYVSERTASPCLSM